MGESVTPGPAKPSVGHGRRGFTLAEVLVAMLCAGVLMHLAVSAQLRLTSAVRREIAHLDAGSSLRTARVIVGRETRWTSTNVDWSFSAGDSVRLRAVRGTAYPCATSGAYAFQGVREPNVSKDSLLVLTPDGTWHATRLVRSMRRGSCYEWHLEPDVPDVALALLFERGSYHLADGALRYRAGRGGRQPVTGVLPRGLRLVPGSTVLSIRPLEAPR